MKVKLDENLPGRLKPLLEHLGHDADTDAEEGLSGRDDDGTHAGLLLVRLREPGANALLEHIGRAVRENSVDDWAGRFVVLTERKIRVRRT